jgi:hypothetical protein
MVNLDQLKATCDYAIAYTSKGYSVIPLKPKSKQPSVPSWKPFTVSKASIEQLENWFIDSDNNIGIITGRISSIFAIDIDGQDTYNFFIQKIESLSSVDKQLVQSIKDTMRIKTGSGNTNLIFRFDPEKFPIGDELANTILWKDSSANQNNHSEIRLKGEGGYIVVPPSIHENDEQYKLVNGINPILLTRNQIETIIDLFSKKNDVENDFLQVIEILKPHYNNGIRNDLVLYLSGWLRKLDIPLEAAEELINELAKDDIEKGNRIRTLTETYKKQDLNEIAGYSGLLKILCYDCTDADAKEKLKKVKDIIDNKFEASKDNKNGKDEEEEEEEKIDITSLIKEYYVDLFVNQFNKPFIAIKINGHVEILELDSQRFKNWLFRFFYENIGKINSELVENTIKVLKAGAEFSENRKTLELRVAKLATNENDDDYTFYYDLTNSNWCTVKITPEGWTIENNPPILFRRYANQLPQVTPISTSITSSPSSFLTMDDKDDTILDKFIDLLNVKDNDNKLLLKCYIISLFIPGISKPILMLHGEQGSAKTTLQELIKMLVDPSIVKTLTFPRDINELVQQLSHNYIAYYDNISIIKEQISNALCRAVTGTGFSKRQLYTDDDDIIYYFLRCIGFNGINLAATKADLLDRGIIIQLERILRQNRRKIEDIWKDFEVLRPQLLAYIFDILVKVLRIKQEGGIKISNGLNRMADFEEYAEIIARCMGYREGEFLRVYQDNISLQIDEAIEANPLAQAIIELMADEIIKDEKTGEEIGTKPKEPLTMTPTNLHRELENIALTKLNLNVSKIKSWPKSPNQLSRKLTEAHTTLREKGIIIERYKDEKGHRKIKICKVSSISPYRQELEKHEQNHIKSLDDTLDDTKTVSSNNINENQEQNNGFGRFDGVDDTLQIIVREHLSQGKSLKCHHKNCNDKEFHSLEAYNNHCHSRHPKQPMYPELSLIEMMGLEPKGNPWE